MYLYSIFLQMDLCNSHKVLASMALLCGPSSQFEGVVIFYLLLTVFSLFFCLKMTLFIAHLGYLHLIRTSCQWFNSVSSWGVEHTASSLGARVLIILYLDVKLWWLSHCRYQSVCVGFPYNHVVKVPSACGVTMMSRNGMESSDLVSSLVNWMDGSTELMCSKNSSLHDWCLITKDSSTYLFRILGGFTAVVMALC